VFLGVSTLSMDTKGRLAIPVKYRKALADEGAGMVVTVNPHDRCLWLYPEREWQPVVQRVSRLPSLKPQNKNLQRLLIGYAEEVQMDGQGRILLSKSLRDYAGMNKQVALVGQGHKFEIWDAEAWTRNQEEWLEAFRNPEGGLSEELANLAL
jgi:MraZ protein